MQYNSEHLKKLLDFIERIYNDKDCSEFAAALRDIVGTDSSFSGNVRDGKIDKIEHYLALDYGLDSVVNHDYDFVADKNVRDTLNADWREMMRIRYGLRGHRIDFDEYARYACLQMEMLLNLYYNSKYMSQEAILTALQDAYDKNSENNPDYRPNSLTLDAKLNGLKSEFGWEFNHYKALFNIKEVRNQESHRTSGKKEKPYIKTWRKNLPFGDVERGLKILTDKVHEMVVY